MNIINILRSFYEKNRLILLSITILIITISSLLFNFPFDNLDLIVIFNMGFLYSLLKIFPKNRRNYLIIIFYLFIYLSILIFDYNINFLIINHFYGQPIAVILIQYIFNILKPSIPYALIFYFMDIFVRKKILTENNFKKVIPNDDEELFREDNIIFILVGVIQTFLALNTSVLWNVFNVISIPFFILFIIDRARGHIKNNSEYRLSSIRRIFILSIFDIFIYSNYLNTIITPSSIKFNYPFYGLILFIILMIIYILNSIVEELFVFRYKKRNI